MNSLLPTHLRLGFLAVTAHLGLILSGGSVQAHSLTGGGLPKTESEREAMREHILQEFMQADGSPKHLKIRAKETAPPKLLQRPTQVAAVSGFSLSSLLSVSSLTGPAGNGQLMAASFAPFKPKVRYNWDGTTFFIEGDNMPDGMPNRMAGITTWQQQVPLPVAYFASTTNPENSSGSLGYKQPNYWRLPLVPTVAPSPTLIFTPGSTNNNFQRGAIAIASNGVAIFNPANNTGRVSYEIGELDYYGGHSGMADDYHYHIIPTHLSSRFGGPLGDDKPLAWALDGYPIYSYVEPDGTARQALDTNGGHDIGNGWGYHYHAIGTNTVDATHPYGTPQSPYTMTSFKGTVVNFGGQVDGQPEVSAIRPDGTGGYNAKPITGAYIVAFMNPAPLVADGSGNWDLPAGVNLTGCSTTFGSTTVNCASTSGLSVGMAIVGLGVSNNATVTQINSATQFTMSAAALANTTSQSFTAVSLAGASADNYLMRVNMGGVDYDECWKINRSANPHTLTMTWRAQALISGQLSGPVVTTTNTYTPNSSNSAAVNRLSSYPMAGPSQDGIPDTSQTIDTTATFGEDSDYSIKPQAFTDNGNGTITDNVTGLIWQKVDNGESTWENAVANASTVTTGGYTDWRLPTPSELFSIFNHNNANPALNTTFFPNNPAGAAEYWWSSDIFSNSTTNVWCSNAGGGLGPKPKSETISAGGTFRYHARYVRGKKPTNGHNYQNNGDGTVTDLDTGLMWTQIPGPAVAWDSAVGYAEGLTSGGYSDWRLPNVKELQTLTDYTLATATGAGAALKPSMNQTMFAKTLTNCVTTTGSTTITCADTTGLIPGMPLVDDSSSDIAGAYIPYTTPLTVSTIVNGTTFTVSSSTGINTGTGLTLKALPPPTAFWTSTSQNNATTNAWVVEFGTNTTSSPQRNSQGIISQNVKTATYPVFAVRTTSVTSQIAVTQGTSALTDGVSTVGYSAAGSKTFTITNTGVTSLTLNGITIDGASAANFTLSGAPANPATLLPNASTTFSVQFGASTAGSYAAALHIANNDPAVGNSFDVNLTGNVAVIDSVALNPTVPSNGDAPYVTAKITPAAGKTLSSVQLSYSVGSGSSTTATVFNETMSGTPTTNGWNGSGASNPWTTVIVNGNGNVNQTGAASNHTPAILLSNCTISGTSVTCSSTTGLWPGMMVAGTGIPAGDTISAVNSSTNFTLASAATSGSGIAVTVAGVTLTNCATNSATTVVSSTTTSGSPTVVVSSASGLAVGNAVTGTGIPGGTFVTAISGTNITVSSNASASGTVNLTFGGNAVTCASTTGLQAGMGVTGTGIPNNSTVYQVTGATGFLLSSAASATGSGLTLTATACGLQFNKGSTTAACSATTTNAINVSGLNNGTTTTSATLSFWASASNISTAGVGWSLQLSTDGGATWPASTSTGAVTEFAAANHGFTQYTYNLQQSELSSNLKLRFNFVGNGLGGATAAKLAVDDITLTKTTTVTPPALTATMYDDGTHGDAVAGDGIYTGQITDSSAKVTGALVSYSITANYTDSTSTALSPAGSYTVTGPLAITTGGTLPNGLTSAPYTQSLVASGGSGSGYSWSVTGGSLPPGVTLGSNGTFSGTPTAAGTYTFTATVTDSAGHTASQSFTITTSTPPNIVVIVTDDQGWADVGYHTAPGQVPIQTPNMDSFGTTMAGSVRLERFYATTVCSVTRSTLLTGRNAIRHATNNERGLDLSEHIMPQTFNAAGYQSYMVGKWHLGGSDKNESFTTVNGVNTRIIQEGLEYAPYNRGWLSHYGQYSGAIDYFTHRSAEPLNLDIPDWWLNGVQQDGASEHTDSQGHGGWSPDLLADKAVSHIQNRDPNKPLLLYVAFNSIHGPVSAPADLLAKYSSIPDNNRRTIAAAVDGMDSAMGRVLTALDTAGITNNTIVVWFSDNGGDTTKGSLNLPLRGTKGDSYDGGMRMPAGIRWPGKLPTGVISNQYMWVGDVFPTLCAAAGVTPQNSPSKPLDGVNLWPSLLSANNNATTTTRGSTLVTVSDAPIAIDKFTDPVNGGTKDFKLIRDHVGNTFPVELYNLTDDPYETTDLSTNSAYASIVTTLTTAITSITPIDYPPYIGPALITNSVAQGGTIELYAPFKSYKSPTVHWRKNGVNLTDGGAISGSTSATQVTDPTSALVVGAYTTKLIITGASLSDAGTYDVVISNVGGSTTSTAGTLTVAPNPPALTTLAAFTKGTSQTVTWAVVPSATGYTVQMSGTSDFASILATQTVTTTSATFSGLTSGSQYFYRATATDGTTSSVLSNVVSSTMDAGVPVVSITSPANNATTTQTSITVQGTASDSLSGIASVTVNGVAATTSDNFAHWTATITLSVGSSTITAVAADNAQIGGNTSSASISVTLNPTAPVISSVSTGPTSPTYLDPVTVFAQVQPGTGATLTQVQLSYTTGVPVSSTIFRETFGNTSVNNWPSGVNSTNVGALNQWITPATTQVRQAVGASNNTAPLALTNCSVSGSTVTCSSTAGLWPGMLITGPNIPGSTNGSSTGNTKISSITSATTFTLSQAASASGSGLTFTVLGVSLANCTTTATSPFTVTCDSTAGLLNGMAVSGTGLANNTTVSSVTDATHFNMSVAPTATGSGLTLIASGAAAEFQVNSATTTSFETSSSISTSGASAAYVEFFVQTRDLAATNNCGWTLQVSPDNGTTWNTRLSEDWNTKTVNLTNCVLNTTGNAAGSTTVTCTSTSGLTAGRNVAGPNTYMTGNTTSGSAIVTNTSTASLAVGMFVTGASGIPASARILSIDSSTQFTMSATATATGTTVAMVATYFPSNASVSSITNGTTFVINTPVYVNTTASPIAVSATTLNHGFQLFHYDLAGNELNGSIKLRFKSTGYAPTNPTRVPRVDIDDVTVVKTTPALPTLVTMYDDGLHGDGAAGDGVYAAQIPVLAGGSTVNFTVTATDSSSASTVSPAANTYTYTVRSSLTDATIVNAEHLSVPTDQSISINAVASAAQDAFVEYGTSPGNYASSTSVTAFNTTGVNGVYPISIALSGLQPNTKYYYRLRHRNAGGTYFNARGERSFRTARPRGTPFVFTIFADSHLDVNTYSDVNDAAHVPQLLNKALDNVTADQPDFHVDLGDILMTDKMQLTDGTGIPSYWGGSVFPTQSLVSTRAAIFRSYYERTTHSVPFLGAQGNHEAEYGYLFSAASDKQNNIPAWNLTARKTYFPAPVPGTFYSGNNAPVNYTGGSLGLPQNYYAWEWGDALFIVLDPYWNTMTNPVSSQNAWNWSLGKTQYDWLKATLQNSSASYKFVFLHHLIGGTWTLADGLTSNCAGRGGIEVVPYFEWGGKNIDGSSGFATNRPGWDMPIHNLLVQNKVNVVFHGHDHLYGYQQLDGITYLECPQPGTRNYSQLGSAADGKYTQGILLPNSGHIRVTVGPNQALAEYVRAYLPTDENATTHNRDVSHSFAMAPRVFAPIEMAPVVPGERSFRWNAVPNKPYSVQWSSDLVNWVTIDTVTFTNTNTNASYTDTNAPRVNQPKGFYRVSYTP